MTKDEKIKLAAEIGARLTTSIHDRTKYRGETFEDRTIATWLLMSKKVLSSLDELESDIR